MIIYLKKAMYRVQFCIEFETLLIKTKIDIINNGEQNITYLKKSIS